MAPYPIGVSYMSIVNQNGRGNLEFTLVFSYILFFIFYGDFEKNQVRTLELVTKLSKGRRLLPAARSPRCKKVQEDDLASQFFKRNFPSSNLLQREVRGLHRRPKLFHPCL